MRMQLLLVPLVLAGCARNVGQNQYNYNEVGRSVIIEYATIVKTKEVDITGRNTGTGAVLGGVAGGAAGAQVGGGDGQLAAAIGGVLIGAVVGGVAEQAMANQKGYEYTVVTEKKKTKTIVQYQNDQDRVFNPGDSVMVQTSGSYQRVLTADDLPEQIKRPKGIKIVD